MTLNHAIDQYKKGNIGKTSLNLVLLREKRIAVSEEKRNRIIALSRIYDHINKQ